MKKLVFTIVCLTLLVPDALGEKHKHLTTLAEKIDATRPSVVRVTCGQSHGTGFFVNSDGYVITASHVVTGPDGNIVPNA
jgi:S1-C subfamily serine protease